MQAITKYFYPFYFIYEVHLLERKQIDKWMHNTKFAVIRTWDYFFSFLLLASHIRQAALDWIFNPCDFQFI